MATDLNYIISEIDASIRNLEKLKREVQQMQGEQGESAGQPSGNFAVTPPGNIKDPLAKSMTDLVTPKQLGMIRALAREAALDPDEECQRVFKCHYDELSKRAASSFIDHLKGCQAEFQQPRRAS